jgi:hypothetical protein
MAIPEKPGSSPRDIQKEAMNTYAQRIQADNLKAASELQKKADRQANRWPLLRVLSAKFQQIFRR